jgi:hypothetical protein
MFNVQIFSVAESKQGADSVAVMDPLEYVDQGSNGFLAELSLSITAFTHTFALPGQSTTEPAGAGTWVLPLN